MRALWERANETNEAGQGGSRNDGGEGTHTDVGEEAEEADRGEDGEGGHEHKLPAKGSADQTAPVQRCVPGTHAHAHAHAHAHTHAHAHFHPLPAIPPPVKRLAPRVLACRPLNLSGRHAPYTRQLCRQEMG